MLLSTSFIQLTYPFYRIKNKAIFVEIFSFVYGDVNLRFSGTWMWCFTALFQTRMKFSENEVNMITNKFQPGGKEINDQRIGNLKVIPIITGLCPWLQKMCIFKFIFYKKQCIALENSQKVIQKTFKWNILIFDQK